MTMDCTLGLNVTVSLFAFNILWKYTETRTIILSTVVVDMTDWVPGAGSAVYELCLWTDGSVPRYPGSGGGAWGTQEVEAVLEVPRKWRRYSAWRMKSVVTHSLDCASLYSMMKRRLVNCSVVRAVKFFSRVADSHFNDSRYLADFLLHDRLCWKCAKKCCRLY